MTITFKKVGESVAFKVIESTKKVSKGSMVKPTIALTEPRAVGAKEAPTIIPFKESTKTSLMPWKGWFDRLLKDKLSETQYTTLRNTMYFWPEDRWAMHQQPPMARRVPISPDGTDATTRDVAPGSQPAVDVPLHALDDDPYDSGYFKRDTRRRYVDPEFPHPEIEQLKLDMQDPNDPEVQAAKEKLAAGPRSSPGNGNRFATGPSDFDPTGLRAVMAVTNKAIQKELDKHMPDHVSDYSRVFLYRTSTLSNRSYSFHCLSHDFSEYYYIRILI